MIDKVVKKYHPGEYLRDSLNALDMSAKEFSLRTGISERTLSDLLNEKGDVTFDIANKLSQFFDNSIIYWMNLQNSYNEYLLEEQKKLELDEDFKLLKNKRKYLIEIDIIGPQDDETSTVLKARNALGINRINDLKGFNALYQGSFKLQQGVKQDHDFERNMWVALALMRARKRETAPFDKAKLEALIPTLKGFTTKSPYYFYNKMVKMLSECGVAFVALPYLNNSDVYGVTKWLTSDKVMLAISDRLKRADVFWFTFFHELEHVLFEHKRKILFQTKEEYIENLEEEKLANKLASNLLIDQAEWESFIDKNKFNVFSITKFARKNNVAPFVVLGRLYKEGIVEQGKFSNELLIQYKMIYR